MGKDSKTNKPSADSDPEDLEMTNVSSKDLKNVKFTDISQVPDIQYASQTQADAALDLLT
jgi:hypothetical protein